MYHERIRQIENLLIAPLQPSYWCGKKDDSRYEDTSGREGDDDTGGVWEAEPEGTPGVQCQRLKKIFRTRGGADVRAVEAVNFSAYPGQIMALLGHNGAGKTTTMSMLTGQSCCGL